MPPEAVRSVAGLRSVRPIDGGAEFSAPDATLQVRFLRDGGVFVGWDGALPAPSYALVAAPEFESVVRLDERGDGWMLSTSAGAGIDRVEVDRSGGLTFFAADDGPALRRDEPPVRNGSAGEDGADGPGADGSGWWHRSPLPTDDAVVLGLGGRSSGLDRRGRRFRLWNSDPGGSYSAGTDPLSLTMPVYTVVSSAGCALTFYDNSFDGSVDVTGSAVGIALSGGPLRYYVFGGRPGDVLERFTALTGRPALPPRWALGYHQSRWGYGDEQALRDVVAGFERHDLDLAAIWLDIDHLVRRRTFEPDIARFPDLAGLADRLRRRGTHLVAIVDPAVPDDRGSAAFRSGVAEHVFCTDERGRMVRGVVWPGRTVFPDFTSPAVRRWWGGLYREYLDLEVAGFWHDMNEPTAFAAFGDPTLPLSTRHDLDGRGGDHREAHNVYGLLMNRAGYDGLVRQRPDRRPFLVSRSGWVGSQRYAGSWSGDISSSWESLRISLWFTLGLGTCGMPWSGPDIGGFDAHPSDELYVRWFQLASMLPFFRTHSSVLTPPREPWSFGPGVLDSVRSALRDRSALLPYWYTLAWTAHRTGAPYVRPMLWADPDDPELWQVDDAFMLGDHALVAPVLQPGVAERSVRLPAGRWYDRRTGTGYDGPGTIRLPAGLWDGEPAERAVPLLVRAGTILPVAADPGSDRAPSDHATPDHATPDHATPDHVGADRPADAIALEVYRPAPDDPEPPGGMLITDRGDGWDEPVIEHFEPHRIDAVPYSVRRIPS